VYLYSRFFDTGVVHLGTGIREKKSCVGWKKILESREDFKKAHKRIDTDQEKQQGESVVLRVLCFACVLRVRVLCFACLLCALPNVTLYSLQRTWTRRKDPTATPIKRKNSFFFYCIPTFYPNIVSERTGMTWA
jgi:hypothetical protein